MLGGLLPSLLAASFSSFLSAPAASSSRRPMSAARTEISATATAGADVETLRFLDPDTARSIRAKFGSPVYVYDEASLKRQAAQALDFPSAFGPVTARFAMKSCPNAAVLQTFDRLGLHIDASSGYEVRRAIAAGIAPDKISLSSQEVAPDLDELLALGIKFNACSLRQLQQFGELRRGYRGIQLGLRFNPGQGSGGTGKTNVGGPASSFGIWHELMPQVKETLAEYDLEPARVHTHIGSGSDPSVWTKVSSLSIGLVEQLPSVTVLNLGGGYKVGRMAYETSTELAVVGSPVKDAFEAFADRTGRELHLEIEPGTFLVANSGSLLTTVQDVASTGSEGHEFLKLDSGMTEVLRPSLYGAQHPIVHVPADPSADPSRADAPKPYVLVGHCCESGDLMTPAPDEPEVLAPRLLASAASIGDIIIVEGSGAYCSSMSTKHYNSFPEAAEVMLATDGTAHLIRKRQPVEEIWANEVPYTP